MNGGRWKASVAGMPCTIERTEQGEWIVIIASATLGRRYDLADAICDAGGGVVSRGEAEALAAVVERRRSERAVPGSHAGLHARRRRAGASRTGR